MDNVVEKDVTNEGLLVNLVKQSPKEIREGRGAQVLDDIHTTYKQKIDAVHSKIIAVNNSLRNQLYQLAPSSSISISFTDVNPTQFVDDRSKMIEDRKNLEIWLTALKQDYMELFGIEYIAPKSLLG